MSLLLHSPLSSPLPPSSPLASFPPSSGPPTTTTTGAQKSPAYCAGRKNAIPTPVHTAPQAPAQSTTIPASQSQPPGFPIPATSPHNASTALFPRCVPARTPAKIPESSPAPLFPPGTNQVVRQTENTPDSIPFVPPGHLRTSTLSNFEHHAEHVPRGRCLWPQAAEKFGSFCGSRLQP